jgi:hypothetical protein
MTMFLEDPLPIILVGIVVVAVLAFAYVNVRRGALLWAIAATLAVVLVGVAVERLVVTDREQVEATLDGVIEAMEADDWERLKRDYIAPGATYTLQRAEFARGLIAVISAKANRLEVTVNPLTSPPTAEAQFTGVISYRLRDPANQFPYDYYVARFVVELQKEGDRWMISNHEEQTRPVF